MRLHPHLRYKGGAPLAAPRGLNHLSQFDNQTSECGSLAEPESGTKPVRRVLILGGGFGGIYAALEFESSLRNGLARP